jgi:two-component system, NarL family, response regulator NreC
MAAGTDVCILEVAMSVRVMIADDHPLVRSGLRGLLERSGEFQVVAEAADGYQAIELAILHKPDVILLDVGMPRLSGPDAAQSISQKLPAARIVMLSMHSDEAYVLRALKAGARGYLLKASPEADVLTAIRAVAAGNAYFSPSITKLLVEEYVVEVRRRGVEDSYDLLSTREKEVLQLLASGKNNREIAELLFISVATVETHRNNIFQKLHLHNLAELILYAVRKGLIS